MLIISKQYFFEYSANSRYNPMEQSLWLFSASLAKFTLIYIGKNDALKQFATGFFSPKRRGIRDFLSSKKAGISRTFNKTGVFIARDIAIKAFVIGATH